MIAGLAVSVAALTPTLSQASETILYNQPQNARSPQSILVADTSGTLYGTSSSSLPGPGAVFALTPPAAGQTMWTETTLYQFQGAPDGANSYAALTADGAGGFFGTTSAGGSGACSFLGNTGCGTVFHLTPPSQGQAVWNETILYSFSGGADGATPCSALLFSPTTGLLYGTTYLGGTSSAGTVFSLTTKGTEVILHSFTGDEDGGFPFAHLIADSLGNVYGTATAGGMWGAGTVFKLTPPAGGQTSWTETVLYNFEGFNFIGDGSDPTSALVFDANGDLYGTTAGGGGNNAGTVFELTPPNEGQASWTENVLYSFPAAKDGVGAFADIIMDGKGALYSTTASGGTRNAGTVFALSPPVGGQTAWTEKRLHSFQGGANDGAYPYSGLIAVQKGNKTSLIGVTSAGGTGNSGDGVVYEILKSGFAR